MKLRIKQKFPCGYEIEIDASSIMSGINASNLNLGIFPIHGNECKEIGK